MWGKMRKLSFDLDKKQELGTVFSKRAKKIILKHSKDEISIENTKVFLYDMLEPSKDRDDMRYRYEHSIRVSENGKMIARAEGLNEQDLVIACLLHDVGYRECMKIEDFSIHQFISADVARAYLTLIGYPSDRMEKMVRAISLHNLTDTLPDDMDAFEMSVRDSDDIDRYDVIRIALIAGSCVREKSNKEIIESCQKEIYRAAWQKTLRRGTETAEKLIGDFCDKRMALLEEIVNQAKKGF